VLGDHVFRDLAYPLVAVGAPVCQPGASQTTKYTFLMVSTSNETVAGFAKSAPVNVILEALMGSTTLLAFRTFVLDERK
jgi:hypothetical protein